MAGAEAGSIRLTSHTNAPVWSGGTLHATLAWQARRAPQGDYGVKVRLVDATGHAWLEQQNRHPVGGTYPTTRWQVGEHGYRQLTILSLAGPCVGNVPAGATEPPR